MPLTIYLLSLKNKKFYVGRTNLPMNQRFQQHKEGEGAGSAWTQEHEPLHYKILEHDGEPQDQDKWTKKMMAKHSIDSVRGGAYVKKELDEEEQTYLNKFIRNQEIEPQLKDKYQNIQRRNASDRCLRCGSIEHFVAECQQEDYVESEEEASQILETQSEPSSDSSCSDGIDEPVQSEYEQECSYQEDPGNRYSQGYESWD